MVNVGFIYMITVCDNHKRYIGLSTRKVKLRVREHLSDQRRHLHGALYQKKYKIKTLRTIRYKKRRELFDFERYYINKLKPELNRL